jgi:hypothetical protein
LSTYSTKPRNSGSIPSGNFAQVVLGRFIQLLSLLEEGEWTYDATDSWMVRILTAFAKTSHNFARSKV